MKTIVAISGSLRKDSLNTALLVAAAGVLPADTSLEILDIGTLPLYNEELEADFPKAATELKAKIEAADAILFSTPEYNRSIPGPLKNAIDWISRPYGKNSLKGKPAAVIGASMGQLGTALAQYHLKQILAYLDAKTLGQPEFYLSAAHEKFGAKGELTDGNTRKHLKEMLEVLVSKI